MPDSKKVLLIGSSVMELSLNCLKLPEAGERVTDDGGVAYLPGGAGLLTAAALTKLGLTCLYCSKVGADAHGKKLYDFYKETGIDTSVLKVDKENPTALDVTLREGDGTERKLFYPGASATLVPENLADAFAASPAALVLDFSVPAQVLLSAAKAAAARNIPVCVYPKTEDKNVDFTAYPTTEVFVADEDFAEALTGIRPTGADSSLRAGLALYRKVNCKYLVIRLGARGSFLYDGKHYYIVPVLGTGRIDLALPGVEDAFFASLILGMLTGADLRDSAKLGSAAATLAATAGGGLRSFPSSEETYEFLSKNRV